MRDAFKLPPSKFTAFCVFDGSEEGRRRLYSRMVEQGVALTSKTQAALDVFGVSLSTLICMPDLAREKAREGRFTLG